MKKRTIIFSSLLIVGLLTTAHARPRMVQRSKCACPLTAEDALKISASYYYSWGRRFQPDFPQTPVLDCLGAFEKKTGPVLDIDMTLESHSVIRVEVECTSRQVVDQVYFPPPGHD